MKPSVGAVGAEQRGCDAGFGAVGDFHRRGVSAHFGFDPAGMHGVYLDGCVLELVSKVDSEGVEGGL